MTYLISPTEPNHIKTLGRTSSLPESYGVDVMWISDKVGKVGIQRKEIRDFVASLNGDRLGKELVQMEQLDFAMLVLEGRLTWNRDGELVDQHATLTQRQLRSVVWSCLSKKIWVDYSSSINDTMTLIESFATWLEKDSHSSLIVRSGPKPNNKWGVIGQRDFAIHILTSFPSIGRGTAESLLEYFGKVPLNWTIGQKELEKVPGIGKKRAEKLIKALESVEGSD